jgi:hypothetical protein
MIISALNMTTRLYCYVDESGQDTATRPRQERIFIVAVAIFEDKRDDIDELCEKIERESGKGRRKWNSCNTESRLTYWRMVLADDRFKHTLCFTKTQAAERPDFDARTILSIAKAVQWRNPEPDYSSDIYVDGISESKQSEYARELRAIGVHVRRIHRARDEGYALIRLADALAGLARAASEGDKDARHMLQQALRRGVVAEL